MSRLGDTHMKLRDDGTLKQVPSDQKNIYMKYSASPELIV